MGRMCLDVPVLPIFSRRLMANCGKFPYFGDENYQARDRALADTIEGNENRVSLCHGRLMSLSKLWGGAGTAKYFDC